MMVLEIDNCDYDNLTTKTTMIVMTVTIKKTLRLTITMMMVL